MPRRYCGSCRGDLHADDGHSECVSCLGKAHADAALAGSDCSHCESISLASLRTRIAFFSESDPAPRALPFSSSQGPVRKKQRGRGFQRLVESELTPAQIPRASFSPHRELSPVLFIQPDQRPSASVSDLVSFGGSDDELADDSMSLVASDAEELCGSVTDPAPSGLPAPSAAKAGMDAELFRVLSKAVEELGLEWSPPEEPSRSRLDEWFLPGRRQAPQQRPSPFFPEVHDELTRSWHSPYSARLRTSASSALTTVDGAEEKGYERMPQLDESVAAHLCPPTAIGWKAKASHPSKPCRTTSALAGRSYASAGQAASALHSMAVLQVYQAKLLSAIDESEPDPATLRELRSATDLALRATKTTAQAIGRSMASLVVLERHLWLTLTEIKDADRVSFLDAPISPSGLFGPAVKGFAERFTEAQKASQAMRHFLPKRSSPAAAQSRPRTAPTQQSAKPAPAVYAPQPARTQQPRGRSRSARRHPPPTRQGPRLKIALDPVRPASSWSAGQEEERVESRHGRTAHQKASHGKPLGTPFFSGCRGNCVCCYRVRTSDHATVRCDSGKNKTQTFSKREQFSSSVPHECPASVQPATRVYPTPCHAGRGLAGHPRSVRVGYGDNKTRLFTPIRSKTPALQRRGLHLGAGRERSRSALRGDDAAGKRSHRNGFSSFERVRLLQPLLPRPQKGWRPPAHPRSQTPESRPHETAVQDDHTEADPLADLHRGLVLFSGPERCILSHPDSPPSQTILEIRLRGSGLPVHGPTLWAVSGPPYFYEVHGRGSFPSETDGNPHSQLPRRLAHSGPVRGGTTFTQNPHPQPLRAPGAQGQFRQKRTVSQPTNIVPGYSSGLSSHESGDSARTRSGHSETRGHLQERHRSPTQSVSENAGPYGRSIASVTAGPAPHAPPSTLVETTGSTQRMASRTLAYQGESGLCNSPDPLEEPTVDGEGRGHGVGPHQESCHDRRLQHRLGGAVRRQTDLRPLVEDGERLPHQLLGNASSLSSLPVFPAGPNRTPCADSLRQHVRGVLYKSPGRCLLEAPLYSGRAPSGMGSAQPALAEGSTPAGQTEPRSRYVISEQCPLRGVDAPSAGGSEDLEDLWQGRSRPFRLQRQLSLPNLLFEGQGCVGPRLAQPPPLCIPPDRPASTGRQAYQGTGSQGAIGGPLVEEPTLVVRADSATDSSPLARAPETGSPLSGERNNMAPSTRAVGSLHLAAQWEPTGFPERVLNTISEARAPSTRRLYALKWSVFSTWCLNRGENPSTSELAVVLSFLQELLDKGRSHSTLKVFVAAIAAFHAPIAGQSVGRDNSVVRFLKGARRLNPPRPLTVPTWDLPTVLRALKGPPFEPLQSTDLRSLSLKTALLLALASVKRVGDLQALSTSPACLEFGPNDSKVVLKPRHGYVPKVLSTPFRAQVITLSALPPSEEDRELSLLCPVRALRIYFERSAPFRHTEQLFVSFGNRTKGHPVTKQRLSKWIVDAVMLAYSSLGLQCPIGVRAHSTRGIASSWAWSSGVSITEICTAAGWATPSTFARFYNLDIPALQARVLSA